MSLNPAVASAAQSAYMIASAQVKYPTQAEYDAQQFPPDTVNRYGYWRGLVAQKACDLIADAPRPESKNFEYVMDPVLAMLGEATVDGAQLKVFTSVIVGGEYEAKSQRVLVHFKGKPTQKSATGEESARTDRLDSYQPHGKLVAARAEQLVGHKVRVTVQVEAMKNGNKSRVIKHIKDLGVAKPEDFVADAPQGQQGYAPQGQQAQQGYAPQGQQAQQGYAPQGQQAQQGLSLIHI